MAEATASASKRLGGLLLVLRNEGTEEPEHEEVVIRELRVALPEIGELAMEVLLGRGVHDSAAS